MSMLQAIRDRLAHIGARATFATRHTSSPDDLELEVKGVGRLRWPITRAVAHQLCVLARPARYGLRDKTRLDRSVRDCWEIPRSRVRIGGRRWDRTLGAMLETVRRDLGLTEGIRLRAALHNLLVYQPGQFFLAHQDSEKTADMVGTLVVMLPSAFTGGTLEVSHHRERVVYRGSPRALTFVAFYADCHHRVLPVKTGYRVALTYTLRVQGRPSQGAVPVPETEVTALAETIAAYFATRRPSRWHDDEQREPPDRLVYLLDHQYTQRSLGWQRLKGADVARAAVLEAAAQRLECEAVLALADVHEQWSCEDEGSPFGDYRSRRGWRRFPNEDEWETDPEAEDDDLEPMGGAPELIELLDTGIELRHWIGARGLAEAAAGGVDMDEVCWTKASSDLHPFTSEHEGYMGNWGNTVDRWYHRAAIVLWPRERTFVIRAKASPAWAMAEIASTLRRRDVERARALAGRLMPFWAEVARREASARFLDRTLAVAGGLDDPQLAAALARPFPLERLTPGAAPRLKALGRRYGLEWCRHLLDAWTADRQRGEAEWARRAWTESVPAICLKICADESMEGFAVARAIVAEGWTRTMKQWSALREEGSRAMRTGAERLVPAVLALLEGATIIRNPELHGQMIATLTSPDGGFPVAGLIGLLRAARGRHRGTPLAELQLSSLHEYCRAALAARVATPARATTDWSVAAPRRCRCPVCETLAGFLTAADRTRFEWPLAKPQRAHVHHAIDAADLPVRHTTRRVGRPYTLVLTKTPDLFVRDAEERKTSERDLEWLTRTASAFT
jgi:hypothetical protein